jgi:hypothetical protein
LNGTRWLPNENKWLLNRINELLNAQNAKDKASEAPDQVSTTAQPRMVLLQCKRAGPLSRQVTLESQLPQPPTLAKTKFCSLNEYSLLYPQTPIIEINVSLKYDNAWQVPECSLSGHDAVLLVTILVPTFANATTST